MITGRATAEAVAREIGIRKIEAEVPPDDKADAVLRLQQDEQRLAFVGDAINDAPALSAADTGTDVAIESADIRDHVAVVRAMRISRATIRNIRQKLFWAFAYNIVLIPVAAGILYPR